MPTTNLIVVLGATASGKTRLAVELAQQLDSDIISADSRQVYRGMDLGTGKDLQEYGSVPYHLIDLVEPGYEFNVFEFQRAFFEVFSRLAGHQIPILCGGTGLYLDAVLRGYRLVDAPENPSLRHELNPLTNEELGLMLQELRPSQHNRTDMEERDRLIRAIEIARAQRDADALLPSLPPVRPVIFGLRWDRALLRQRIALRLKQRLDQGMIAEVEGLLARGVSAEALEFYGLEYRFIVRHLRAELSVGDMTQQLCIAIGQYAKRQETWFRRMERQGTEIHWLEGDAQPASRALAHLEALGLLDATR